MKITDEPLTNFSEDNMEQMDVNGMLLASSNYCAITPRSSNCPALSITEIMAASLQDRFRPLSNQEVVNKQTQFEMFEYEKENDALVIYNEFGPNPASTVQRIQHNSMPRLNSHSKNVMVLIQVSSSKTSFCIYFRPTQRRLRLLSKSVNTFQ
jgi:hypothetical protein